MKKSILILALLTGAVSVALISCSDTSAKPEGNIVISQDSLVKRGQYLVNSIGCDDCHSQKIFTDHGFEIDMDHRFSGFMGDRTHLGKANTSVLRDGYILFANDLTSAVGPWGQSYAANISSDATGIGNWTEDQFITARQVKRMKEGTSYLPCPGSCIEYERPRSQSHLCLFENN
jgi:hypothetical protein